MSTNSPNNPFSREGAESLAHTVRQAQRAMEEHPLSAVHINQGSADAMADAYDAEYQASRTMTTPPNAPDHGCSCGRPDCQYDKAWGNPLRETQPAPDAKPNAPEVDVLAAFGRLLAADLEYDAALAEKWNMPSPVDDQTIDRVVARFKAATDERAAAIRACKELRK